MIAGPTFRVVLHEPQIPNNTGNIGRTCLAMGASLALIGPLGFDLSEKALRRAGLDYWPRLAPDVYGGWASYQRDAPNARRWYLTTKATTPLWRADLRRGDHLVFGKETRGLPDAILGPAVRDGRAVGLPMVEGERSLNLATAVCAALCEGLRQLDRAGQLPLRGTRIAAGPKISPANAETAEQ